VNGAQGYFRTDAVRAELGGRAVRSGLTTVSARGAQMVLQFGSTIALARLLTPDDFGVLAMVLPAAILVNQIANQGLQSAIIHREELTGDDASQLFWAALRRNLVVTGLLAAVAPALSRVYGEPRVVGVAIWWAITIYLTTLASVHEALLKRQMRFGLVVGAQLAALVTSIAVAITAALLGAGHWSLMLQVSVMEVGRAAIMWRLCPWRPARAAARAPRSHAVRAMREYWANLSGSRTIAWLGDQMDRILMGAVGGAPVLGLYDAAKRWAWAPFLELWIALSDTAVASLSRARHDPAQYQRYYRNFYLPLYSVALPAIVFAGAEARSLVLVLLGDRWSGAIPYLRLLAVAATAATLGRLVQWVYLSTGDTRRQLRWALVTTPLMLLSLIAGARFGAPGVAAGFTAGTVALALPTAWNALRSSPVTMKTCLAVYGRPFFAAMGGAAALWIAAPVLPGEGTPLVSLAVRFPIFVLTYGASWIIIPGGRGLVREAARSFRLARRRLAEHEAGTPVAAHAATSPHPTEVT
jgi:PST family polysaccharide transporter